MFLDFLVSWAKTLAGAIELAEEVVVVVVVEVVAVEVVVEEVVAEAGLSLLQA